MSVETNISDTHPPAPSWNNHARNNSYLRDRDVKHLQGPPLCVCTWCVRAWARARACVCVRACACMDFSDVIRPTPDCLKFLCVQAIRGRGTQWAHVFGWVWEPVCSLGDQATPTRRKLARRRSWRCVFCFFPSRKTFSAGGTPFSARRWRAMLRPQFWVTRPQISREQSISLWLETGELLLLQHLFRWSPWVRSAMTTAAVTTARSMLKRILTRRGKSSLSRTAYLSSSASPLMRRWSLWVWSAVTSARSIRAGAWSPPDGWRSCLS